MAVQHGLYQLNIWPKGERLLKEGGGSKYNEPSPALKFSRFSFTNKLYRRYRVTLKSDIIQMFPGLGIKRRKLMNTLIPGRYRFICERLRNRIEVYREPIGILGPQFLCLSDRVSER